MSVIPRVPAALQVVHGPGNVCHVDLTTILPACASIEVAVDAPHWVNVQPSVVYVTPTAPKGPAAPAPQVPLGAGRVGRFSTHVSI
ncbi:hypothetical protein B0T16DRAFT_48422 [Cercophora newfieldiana]|uniref:Uncharacterized protein n=1 Tax=Cercophora newfieldiana TaxID=92897 RepID=A0AA40D1K9_9PEZI|nr:hypothetical protein B0T16DRAFT_48422 [Cercophora newfieldiana]